MPEQVDRRITEPHYNEEFLSWFSGVFDQVYIALHPFSTVANLNPENIGYQTEIINRNEVEGPLTFQKYAQLSHAASASKTMNKTEFANLQKREGKRITWKNMCDACGFDTVSDLNRVLLTKIQAAKTGHEDEAGVEKIVAYCRDEKIFFPTEDTIQPLMEQQLFELMQLMGIDKVWLSNEFNENKKVLKLKELQCEGPWDEVHDLGFKLVKAYDTGNTFLAAVPWDNFYTVLCGKGTALADRNVEKLFEGFWCTPKTKPEW